MMNFHIFQHVPFEEPGYIAHCVAQSDYTLSYTRFYEPGHTLLSPLDLIDALIIMGGPMNVYADHQYEWLSTEKAFIKDFIQTEINVMGICLGAQLAALCLGARSIRSTQ
jgi:GMP synthase-like glutamine amidotransferase